MRIVLCPEWLVDGTGVPALENQAVIVSDGLIGAVLPADAYEPQEGDEILDLAGATLIPGLINNHVHLVLPGDNTSFESVRLESDTALALRAAHNAAVSLRSGVTTVRDCGGQGITVLDVRNALANDRIPGARVISCGWPITITGGHVRYFGGEADGEDALRRMVRRIVSAGADFVKVLASGGGTLGSFSQYPSFSVAELRVIVEVAHSLARPVAAHCTATASISNAVEAGVDWIEHGLFMEPDGVQCLDYDVAERLAESGIPVTTTMQVARDMVQVLPTGEDQSHWQRWLAADRVAKRQLREMGVRFLAGSDAGWRATGFDTFWKELDELVGIGMNPIEAIHAATGAVAGALRCADQCGTIKDGRVADMVAVGGDAAHDISRLADVQAVFQAGVRVRPR